MGTLGPIGLVESITDHSIKAAALEGIGHSPVLLTPENPLTPSISSAAIDFKPAFFDPEKLWKQPQNNAQDTIAEAMEGQMFKPKDTPVVMPTSSHKAPGK